MYQDFPALVLKKDAHSHKGQQRANFQFVSRAT